jgi:hypothetical protein
MIPITFLLENVANQVIMDHVPFLFALQSSGYSLDN